LTRANSAHYEDQLQKCSTIQNILRNSQDDSYEKNYHDAEYAYKFACKLDDVKKAVKLFDKCISYQPDAYLFEARANCLWESVQKEAAIRDWTDAIKIDRDYWRLYYQRANAYLAMNKLSSAISDFEAARRLCDNLDNDPSLNIDYAEGLVKLKRYDEALRICERFIARSKENGSILEQAKRIVSQINQP